jgi:hypothetical protein
MDTILIANDGSRQGFRMSCVHLALDGARGQARGTEHQRACGFGASITSGSSAAASSPHTRGGHQGLLRTNVLNLPGRPLPLGSSSQRKVLTVCYPPRPRPDHHPWCGPSHRPTTACGSSVYCFLFAPLAFKQVVARSSRARLIVQPMVQLGTLITSPCGSRRRSVKCSIATT